MWNSWIARKQCPWGWVTQGCAGRGRAQRGHVCVLGAVPKEEPRGVLSLSYLYSQVSPPSAKVYAQYRDSSVMDTGGKGTGIRIISKRVLRRTGWMVGNKCKALNAAMDHLCSYIQRAGRGLGRTGGESPFGQPQERWSINRKMCIPEVTE